MKLFTILELFNKLSGFIIVSIYARILGVELFAEFTAILVVFGYFLELSYFSYQAKNIAETNKLGLKYLDTGKFKLRLNLILLFSLLSAYFFYFFSKDTTELNVLPLALVILLSAFNIDYILYGTKNSKHVVISRFIGQLLVLFIILIVYHFDCILSKDIFIIQLTHTLLLILLVTYFAHRNSLISFSLLSTAIHHKVRIKDALIEVKQQTSVFLSKVTVLVIVTVELPLLLFFQNDAYHDLAVGHRITLILLPFLLFYLNANIEKINKNTLKKSVLISSISSCVLVLLSPFIVYVMFGNEFMSNVSSYSVYFYLIVFQTFINYGFYIALREEAESKLFKVLLTALISYTLIFTIIAYWQGISQNTLIMLSILKVTLVVTLSAYGSIRQKSCIIISIFFPLILSILLSKVEYFNLANDFLLHSLQSIPYSI